MIFSSVPPLLWCGSFVVEMAGGENHELLSLKYLYISLLAFLRQKT